MSHIFFPTAEYTGEIYYNSDNATFYLKVATVDGAFYKLQVQDGTTSNITEIASTEANEVNLTGYKFYALPAIQKSTDAPTAIRYELLAYDSANDPTPAETTGFYYFDDAGSWWPFTGTGTAPTTPYTAPATETEHGPQEFDNFFITYDEVSDKALFKVEKWVIENGGKFEFVPGVGNSNPNTNTIVIDSTNLPLAFTDKNSSYSVYEIPSIADGAGYVVKTYHSWDGSSQTLVETSSPLTFQDGKNSPVDTTGIMPYAPNESGVESNGPKLLDVVRVEGDQTPGGTPVAAGDHVFLVTFDQAVHLPVSALFVHADGGSEPTVEGIGTSYPGTGTGTMAGTQFYSSYQVVVRADSGDDVWLQVQMGQKVSGYDNSLTSKPTDLVLDSNSMAMPGSDSKWMKLWLDDDLNPDGWIPNGIQLTSVNSGGQPVTGVTQPIAAYRSEGEPWALYLEFADGATLPNTSNDGYFVVSATGGWGSPLGGLVLASDGSVVSNNVWFEDRSIDKADPAYLDLLVANAGDGFDTLDLFPLSGALNISSEAGTVTYGSDKNAGYFVAENYEGYILNTAAGNRFTGSAETEYIYLGTGGGNFLDGGGRVAGSQLRETDTVDYSRVGVDDIGSTPISGVQLVGIAGFNGISVDLGNRADAEVTVTYNGTTLDADTIIGFEGFVGSRGDDTIYGSNVGNFLAGGRGDDTIYGYSNFAFNGTTGAGDALYGQEGLYTENYNAEGGMAQFVADTTDFLYGGEGDDTLYGGAGSDILVDFDAADLYGAGDQSSTRKAADAPAEHDVFVVRGKNFDTVNEEIATIHNYQMSADGTGLSGRSTSANDGIIFSVSLAALVAYDGISALVLNDNGVYEARDGKETELYTTVQKGLSFTSAVEGEDILVTAKFTGTLAGAVATTTVGAVRVDGIAAELSTTRDASVVELDWLSELFYSGQALSQKADFSAFFAAKATEMPGDLNFAIALEETAKGTVRGVNANGVMAGDHSLDLRIYNPGFGDDRIIGSVKADRYSYLVQDFSSEAAFAGTTAAPQSAGRDRIFDVGGFDELTFADAKIADLSFKATQVGRESDKSSLEVTYTQTNPNADGGALTNSGSIVWQGHFKDGGRQAAETVDVMNAAGDGVDSYFLAQTEYTHNFKGQVVGGPEIVAGDVLVVKTDSTQTWETFADTIMVGQYGKDDGGRDTFVFETGDAAAAAAANAGGFTAIDGSLDDKQVVHFWNADAGDIIDLTSYVAKFGGAGPNAGFELIESDISDGSVTVGFLSDTTAGASTQNAFTLDLVFHSDTNTPNFNLDLSRNYSDEILLAQVMAP